MTRDHPAHRTRKRSNDFPGRLRQHNSNKDFWDRVIVPTSKDANLTKAHARYLESRFIDIAKLAGKYAEQQRIAVRNVRHHGMDDLKAAEKDGVITKDEHHKMQTEVQKLTDEAIKRIDEALKSKEQEIMQV